MDEQENVTQTEQEEIPVVTKVQRPKAKQVDEALKSFESQQIEQPKAKKHKWLGNVLLLAIIGVGIYLMFRITTEMGDENMKSLAEVLAQTDVTFALLTVLLLLSIFVFDALKYAVIMRALDGKFHARISLKVMFLGKYYDYVTPFSTGGQPMQIYYLHKKGFSGGVSTAVIMIKHFTNVFIWLILSGLLLIFRSSALEMLDAGTRTTLTIGAWVGWGINMLQPAFIVVFLIAPNLMNKIVGGIISLGAKMRLIKDKEKTMQKAMKVVDDFISSFSIMSRHPVKFILLLLFCAVEVALSFAIPYFVMRTFSALPSTDFGLNTLLDVMALNIFATFSAIIFPTPGSSGFTEGAISLAFRTIIASSVLFWVLFTWRFLVYYIYIVIGIGITIFEFIRNIVRNRRNKREEKE